VKIDPNEVLVWEDRTKLGVPAYRYRCPKCSKGYWGSGFVVHLNREHGYSNFEAKELLQTVYARFERTGK